MSETRAGTVGAYRAIRCRPTPHVCPQLADVVDSEALQVYMKPPAHEESKAPSKGFVVRDAPWTANSSEKVRRHPPALHVPWEVGARSQSLLATGGSSVQGW